MTTPAELRDQAWSFRTLAEAQRVHAEQRGEFSVVSAYICAALALDEIADEFVRVADRLDARSRLRVVSERAGP
jgi:hypothetical protein